MAVRWSGDVRVRLTALPTGMCEPHRYDVRVDVPGSDYTYPVWRNTITLAPFFSSIYAIDNPVAYDKAAEAALSFWMNDCDDDCAYDWYVNFDDKGNTKVARRKDRAWK